MRFPWVAAGLAAVFLAVAFISGSAEALQYDRARVIGGEVWLLVSGQLVHWTARMAMADLGVLLALAAVLELQGERRRLLVALGLGVALTAVAVFALSPGLLVYRGSSGVASALFVLTALGAARAPGRGQRALAWLAVALFLAKAGWESLTGEALFAGPLTAGVEVVPLVHLLGGLAGLVAGGHRRSAIFWRMSHRFSSLAGL